MNKEELALDLRKKGWSEEEITHALRAIDDASKEKSRWTRFLDQIIYWVFLIVTILGNFIVAVWLVPVMLVANPMYLYPIMVIVGLTFGFLFDNIIKDILDIEDAPKIMPELFLPAIALIVVYIMARLSNLFAELLQLSIGVHEPIIVGIFYTLGFMLPYYFTHAKEQRAKAPPPPKVYAQ